MNIYGLSGVHLEHRQIPSFGQVLQVPTIRNRHKNLVSCKKDDVKHWDFLRPSTLNSMLFPLSLIYFGIQFLKSKTQFSSLNYLTIQSVEIS
jgi:hypothetical protein